MPRKVVVIGAGPAGYVCAIRLAQLGQEVTVVEREYLGGTCLNVGCIPSKAMLDSSHKYELVKHGLTRQGIKISGAELDLPAMIRFKADVVQKNTAGVGFLFKKNKIEHIKGHGKITAPGQVQVEGKTYSAKNILIATGSAPIQIPALPFDGKNIISSTEALALTELPKRMIVVGGGYIGVEMGSVWSRLGSDVLVLEFLSSILPASDKEMAGDYYGYDGPCPPWNDERPHRYVFTVYALDVARLAVEGRFGGLEARRAVEGHVLAQASITGRYTLNPAVRI